MSSGFVLPPIRSWQEFLDAATRPPTSPWRAGSRRNSTAWANSTWEEAVQLGRDGWPQALDDADVTVAGLRAQDRFDVPVTTLEPSWDVMGSEVDVGAYLTGVPECMVEATPQRVSRRGKVVTFVVPLGYTHTVPHRHVVNRGLALATLCAAIVAVGHSVEIWSGDAGMVDDRTRFCAMVRVVSAGEPFDIGRLVFAVAHPAMCRRLSFGLWDAQPPPVAVAMSKAGYGKPPYACRPTDLPEEITDPYVFPHLDDRDTQWTNLPRALDWCRATFMELGLIAPTNAE